jgi:hypothetical protein
LNLRLVEDPDRAGLGGGGFVSFLGPFPAIFFFGTLTVRDNGLFAATHDSGVRYLFSCRDAVCKREKRGEQVAIVLTLECFDVSDAAVSMVVQVFNWMASKPVSGSLASNSQPRDLTARGLWLRPRPFKICEVSKVPFAAICDLQMVPHIVACTKQRPDALVRTSCYQIKR